MRSVPVLLRSLVGTLTPALAVCLLALSGCASSTATGGDDAGANQNGDQRMNGALCAEGTECASGHCQNGFCCASGDCCALALNCPATYTAAPTCDEIPTCQGSRTVAACVDYTCDSSVLDEDTACGVDVLATECGAFQPIFCTGEETQLAPTCPTECLNDDDCIEGYHCDTVCVADVAEGLPCDENTDCDTGYCNGGICCTGGDCCTVPGDCPALYTQSPRCDSVSTCQGTRRDPVCVANVCGTSDPIEDDSGCAAGLEAKPCAPYSPVYCSGQAVQAEPLCAANCAQDGDCEDGYHCDDTCQADLQDGFSCDEDSDCASGHCQNGFCCASGDCCNQLTDCPAQFFTAAVCDSAATCQGHRRDAQCVSHVCQPGPNTDDDSGCAGQLASTCNLYPSVYCSNQQVQSTPQCLSSCTSDVECDAEGHCGPANQCVLDVAKGGSCQQASDCQAGLFCVDNVCCDGPCSGLCEKCNLAGSLGTCSPVPGGQDPDNECNAVSCAGYYDGWQGDGCYLESDAPAAAVACTGGRACQTAAQVCPAQVAGTLANTCHATCQDPTAGTCTGTTPGTCTNVNPGNQTCGTGICQRTVAQCVNGQPNTCTPGNPGIESCNNLDDNCDGVVDNGIAGASDTYEPNNTCGAYRSLGTIAEASSEQSFVATIYPSGDEDWYRFYAEEGSHTCFPGSDQDYRVRVRLVPPAGADCVDLDVELYNDSCTRLTYSNNGSCTAESLEYEWDGSCGGDDSRYFRIRVYGWGGAFECVSYTLYIDMWQV